MKKSFSLTSTVHKPDRQVELVKHEINKYIARERRKTLPDKVDFWDFDCKCGATAEAAEVVHVAELGKHISKIAESNAPAVYVEVLAKPGIRKKKWSSLA